MHHTSARQSAAGPHLKGTFQAGRAGLGGTFQDHEAKGPPQKVAALVPMGWTPAPEGARDSGKVQFC